MRATLANAVNDRSSVDMKDLDTRAWVRAMTRRVVNRFPDEEAAREFLGLVRYEAMRAGLDPHLVLAVIEVESHFRKYAVSKAGARGFMQVMPFWVRELGEPSHNLFQERVNLRYGCTILRHYLDCEARQPRQRAALAATTAASARPTTPTACCAPKERWARFGKET